VLSYNAGPKFIIILHKKICNISPGDFTKRFISGKQKKKICKMKRKLLFEPRSRRVTKNNLPDMTMENVKKICVKNCIWMEMITKKKIGIYKQ
jgi:hypothetical protein